VFKSKCGDIEAMAYKGSVYYDDYDLDSYNDFDYSYDDVQKNSFGIEEVFNCGITVLKQISNQLFYVLAINLLYRVIRQTGLI
jgi:hypothetical protein